MSTAPVNPDLDLVVRRIIRAQRQAVWRAWTDATLLAQWWTPAPTVTRVERLQVRPGGGFVTQMSDDGSHFVAHTDAVFLVVEDHSRLVFTNAVDSGWRPASPEPIAMTAEIIFDEHPDGTNYQAIVRHRDPVLRARHEELGFFDGWGAVTEALAQLAETAGNV